MKKTLLLVLPLALGLAGCGQSEETPVPLSPQAQEALRSGNTGIPAEAAAGIKAGPPTKDTARAADMPKK